jgi:hypothetical protein
MIANRSAMSCGVMEIYNLDQGPKGGPLKSRETRFKTFLDTYKAFRQGADRHRGPLFPIVVFSDNTENGWGETLKEDINAKGDLGVCRSTIEVTNENTGRAIKLYFWKPSQSYKDQVKAKGIY